METLTTHQILWTALRYTLVTVSILRLLCECQLASGQDFTFTQGKLGGELESSSGFSFSQGSIQPVRRGYPIRPDWNSTQGDSLHGINPVSRVVHMSSGAHYGKYDVSWLQGLSHAEIESLHKDDHGGTLQMAYVVRPTTVSGLNSRNIMQLPNRQLYYQPAYDSACPGGVCPTPAGRGWMRFK